jgi:hypothetical protein
MDRSKSRIAAIMLSALACSGASKADTRALSTAGKILTALGAVVGATEIYNEVSAVVSKKQGKEPKWCTGRYSFYNLLSNSKKKSDEKPEEKPEKNQTFTLNDNQKLVIQVMFKNVVNEGEEDDNIQRYKNFFNGEMLVADNDKAKEGFEIFKKFLDGQLTGNFNYNGCKYGRIDVNKSGVRYASFFFVGNAKDEKIRVIYNSQLMLTEK